MGFVGTHWIYAQTLISPPIEHTPHHTSTTTGYQEKIEKLPQKNDPHQKQN